jgi:hypothetical protein
MFPAVSSTYRNYVTYWNKANWARLSISNYFKISIPCKVDHLNRGIPKSEEFLSFAETVWFTVAILNSTSNNKLVNDYDQKKWRHGLIFSCWAPFKHRRPSESNPWNQIGIIHIVWFDYNLVLKHNNNKLINAIFCRKDRAPSSV